MEPPHPDPATGSRRRGAARWLIGPILLVGLLMSLATSCSSDDAVSTSSPTDQTAAESEIQPATGSTTGSVAEETGSAPGQAEELYPDVVAVEARQDGDGTWTFAVTLSSPYDSPQRYADAWRVVGPEGDVYGERILTHDHANEQPFTRSQSGIVIPDGVTEVLVQGRDQISGWGGQTMTVELSR